ncbi:MAG: hypothetical protein ABI691_02345 [Ginsengibacter sp.]
MKKISILLTEILLVSLCSYGQDTTQLIRPSYKLTVLVDKNSFYEEELKSTPYILPGKTVQIYPGETIFIEIEEDNGIIKSMTAVKEPVHPSKTLTISFIQGVKKKTHELMMLKVENPFPKNLIYKAKIFLLKQKKWVDTDVYPVGAGLSGYETWPDIITSIGLNDWQFQSK